MQLTTRAPPADRPTTTIVLRRRNIIASNEKIYFDDNPAATVAKNDNETTAPPATPPNHPPPIQGRGSQAGHAVTLVFLRLGVVCHYASSGSIGQRKRSRTYYRRCHRRRPLDPSIRRSHSLPLSPSPSQAELRRKQRRGKLRRRKEKTKECRKKRRQKEGGKMVGMRAEGEGRS